MMLMLGRQFSRRWPGRYSASSSVVTHMIIHGNVVDHSPIHIGVVNHRGVYVHHRRVVSKHSAIPAPAKEPNSTIAKSIINSAVESDVRPPISCVKKIPAAAPAPITRRPKIADSRRHDPRSRHPVITIVAIRPIAGRPKIPRTRTDRLFVHWERGRT